MIWFIAYTYINPETHEREYKNTITDLSEYPDLSDIREFEKSTGEELEKEFNAVRTEEGASESFEKVQVSVISLQNL